MIVKPLIAAALTLGSVATAPTAQAQRYWGDRYEQPYRGDHGRGGFDRSYDARDGYDGARDDRGYGRGYVGRGYAGYDERGYQGYDGRPRRCSNGTTGTVVGALAGGLLGRVIDTRGDRSLGTILGAGAGALVGRAAERSNNPGFCR